MKNVQAPASTTQEPSYFDSPDEEGVDQIIKAAEAMQKGDKRAWEVLLFVVKKPKVFP